MQILQLLLNKTVNNYRIWWGFYTPCFDVNYNVEKADWIIVDIKKLDRYMVINDAA